MRQMRKPSFPTHDRQGFTLLELLAVITIIAILVALISPSIFRALGTARQAEVTAEMNRLSTGINRFKTDHNGVMPWSAVIIPEDPGTNAWGSISKSRIRRVWPQFNFSTVNDLNGDGDTDDELTLTASECLVFFLGGVRVSGTENTLAGFSKNPVNPFNQTGSNRTTPFEFDVARLVDTDSDGMLEYVDPIEGQQTPMLYVSSNNGQGYSNTDGSLNYYVQEDGTTPWHKDGFQLISPGEDGEYGFDPAPNPFDSTGGATDSRPVFSSETEVSLPERDNIASFNPGATLGR